MFPVIVEIGPITVYSFGLMMGIAFLVANYLLVLEFRRRGLPDDAPGIITLLCLVAGVAGSKLFSLFENWDAFMADPVRELFSPAGLTFYGGLLLATLAVWWYSRRRRIPFLIVADAASPSLIIAYGIGRIGCQLAGDGDYGIPTDVPWAMSYPNGTVSTLAAKNPGLVEQFKEIFPGQPVPVDIPVHPAPVYETLGALLIFAVLWKVRKRPLPMGILFALYLILAGIERFLVEFIRLNPLYLGLSQAQWISIAMIVTGGVMIAVLRRYPAVEVPAAPPIPRAARRAKDRRRVRAR